MRSHRLRALCSSIPMCAALVLGCREEDIRPAPNRLVIERDGYSLTLETTTFTLALRRGDETLTTLHKSSFVLGTVETVAEETNYDPYLLVAEVPGYLPPAGAALHAAKRIASAEIVGDSLEIEVEHEGGFGSHVQIRPEAEGAFRITLTPDDPSRVVWLGLGADAAEDEAFYGLGELFDDVNQRGKIRAMQLEVDALEGANNEAHVPVPFVIGTRGWGLFVESTYPGVFDVAGTSDSSVVGTFGVGTAAGEGLVAHLFGAEHPLDVTKRYYELTGYPKLPAQWAIGPLVWRDENDDQAQVESDLETMRDLDLATSAIWIDRPYATGVNTFDFDPVKFDNAAGMMAKARALGFRVALWHVPYLDEEDENTAELRATAEREGYYPIETGIELNGWGHPIDFTNPDAVKWWQDNLRRYTSTFGIEGFKLDYAEDVVPGLFGARNVFRFADGSDERTMHRGYTLLYHQTYAEMLPPEGGLLLCRAGKWGDQIHGPIIWPGDLDARFWKHRQEVSEDGETFNAVGGLPASVVAGLTLGPSGFPFYGADTGGYRHSPPDAETFRRWFEQTALSSVMQIGTSSNDVAWEFGDEELLASYRRYTRLHLRLFPYEWTLAQDMLVTGRPIQRAFGLQEPQHLEHPNDEYFFGDALLVAPVTEAGVTGRSVLIPDGEWIGFWDGIPHAGPTTIATPAPLGTLPLFVRRGAMVPMLRPTIDTLSPTSEPDRVDSFDTQAGPLWWLSTVAIEGETMEAMAYDGSRLTQTNDTTELAFEIESGDVFGDGAAIEIIAFGDKLDRITVDELTLEPYATLDELALHGRGFVLDPTDRGGTLTVKIGAGETQVVVYR